ncbi:MAG: hypothetical protein H6625_01970 [Bdellovibrionaceae bacterium]|nr:hypothetical protein [Pseudobdellovibrionaceae bacterium]
MKSLVSTLLVFSMIAIGCGKDSGGGAASPPKAPTVNNQDTAICATANYQNGRWYDYNGVELPQCSKIQNYMNSKYLLAYDNNYCRTRKYQGRDTYHLILNGVNKCAAEEYFSEFGNQQIYPQYGRSHYIGYAPPSYYDYNNGFYSNCYGWGCDIGDGKWNFGDFVAIGLGAGIIYSIVNQ